MNKLLDLDHPFFNPLWRRVVIVALCLGWAGVEWRMGSPFWATMFGGVGLYCAYGFFVAFTPKGEKGRSGAGQDGVDGGAS